MVLEKYTTQSGTLEDENKKKMVISNDAFAILEVLESLRKEFRRKR